MTRLPIIMIGAVLYTAQANGLPDPQFPPEMRVQIVSRHMHMMGRQMRIYAIQTHSEIANIRSFYERQWRGNLRQNRVGKWQVLSSLSDDVLTTVQLSRSNNDMTRGYVVTGKLSRDPGPPYRAGLPAPAGSRIILDIQAVDAGRQSRTLHLLSANPVGRTLDYYRAHFRSQGYRPISAHALQRNENRGAMILNKGSGQVNLVVTNAPGGSLVTLVQVGQP